MSSENQTDEVQAITKSTRINLGAAISLLGVVLYTYIDGAAFVRTTVRDTVGPIQATQDATNTALAKTNESLAGLRADMRHNTEAIRSLRDGYVRREEFDMLKERIERLETKRN